MAKINNAIETNMQICERYLCICNDAKYELDIKKTVKELEEIVDSPLNQNFAKYLYKRLMIINKNSCEFNLTGKTIILNDLSYLDKESFYNYFEKNEKDKEFSKDEQEIVKKINQNKKRLAEVFILYAKENGVESINKSEILSYINGKKIPTRNKFFDIAFALNLESREVIKVLCNCLREYPYVMREPNEFINFTCHSIPNINNIASKNKLLSRYEEEVNDIYIDTWKIFSGIIEVNSEYEWQIYRDEKIDLFLKFINIIANFLADYYSYDYYTIAKFIFINEQIFNASNIAKEEIDFFDLYDLFYKNIDFLNDISLSLINIDIFYYIGSLCCEEKVYPIIFGQDMDLTKSIKKSDLKNIVVQLEEDFSYFVEDVSMLCDDMIQNMKKIESIIYFERKQCGKSGNKQRFLNRCIEIQLKRNKDQNRDELNQNYLHEIENIKRLKSNIDNFTRFSNEEINTLNLVYKDLDESTSIDELEEKIIIFMLVNYKRFDKSQRTISFVFKRLTEMVFEHIEEITYQGNSFLKNIKDNILEEINIYNSDDKDIISYYLDSSNIREFKNEYVEIKMMIFLNRIVEVYSNNSKNYQIQKKGKLHSKQHLEEMIRSRTDIWKLRNGKTKVKKEDLLIVLLYNYILSKSEHGYKDDLVNNFKRFLSYANTVFEEVGMPPVCLKNAHEKYILLSLLNPLNYNFIYYIFTSKEKLKFVRDDNTGYCFVVRDKLCKDYTKINGNYYAAVYRCHVKDSMEKFLPAKLLTEDEYRVVKDDVYISLVKGDSDDYIIENGIVYIKDRIINNNCKVQELFEIDYITIDDNIIVKGLENRYINEKIKDNIVYVKGKLPNKKSIIIESDNKVYTQAKLTNYIEKNGKYFLNTRESKLLSNAFLSLKTK